MHSRQFLAAKSNTLYANTKYEHMDANNFFKNLDQLLADLKPNKQQAEKLDKLLVQSAKCAGASCRKRRRDWWSQKVTELRSQCHLLQRLLSGRHNNIDLLPVVRRRMEDINLQFQLPTNMAECKQMLKIAQNLAREASAQHTQARLTELDERAETYALEGNQDQQKHLKQMAAHESSCKM